MFLVILYNFSSGLALYILLYSLLGALFAVAFGNRLAAVRLTLVGILFGLSWYYLSFRVAGKAAAPLVVLLHAERPTMWGHAIYGALLARYRSYLPREDARENGEPEAEAPAASNGDSDPPA